MSLFGHCQSAADIWRTVHTVASACHPAQGGCPDDMRALCAAAHEALGEAWPWAPTELPNLFDIYCLATGIRNPFGSQGIAGGDTQQHTDIREVGAYDPSAAPFGSLHGAGRVSLMAVGSRAQASSQ